MRKELKELLNNLDDQKITLSYMGEYKIAEQINHLFSKDEKNITNNELAERIAFDFIENYKSDLDWGTYYGPQYILPSKKRKVIIYPHIKQINKEIIKYWKKRAKESKNPVLKSRYADLVIDFNPKILKERADVEFYNIVIDSNIKIFNEELADVLSCQVKLKRAFQLELEIKKEISNNLKQALIQLDKRGKLDKPGTWGFAFELLVLNKNKKIKLTNEEKEELLNMTIDKFNKTKNKPYILEYTTSLLGKFYQQKKDEENLLNLLQDFEKDYKVYYDKQDPISKAHGYQKILEMYQLFSNDFTNIKKEENRIIKEIGQLELDWNKSLKETSIKIEIPREKIEKHLDSVFGKNRKEKIDRVIKKIVISNIPQKEKLKKLYIDLSSKYVLQYIATRQIISSEGYVKAQLTSDISNITNTDNPKFIYEASKYIQYGLLALSIDLEEFKKHFESQDVINYLSDRFLFLSIDKKFLEKILNSYYKKDYLVFSHLVTPLIEKIIRDFIREIGGEWFTTNGYGGFEQLTLHQILSRNINEKIFKIVFGEKMGENIIFYLKLTLTHKLGMEIRTDFAHGKDMKNFLNPRISDLLFYILLIFSLVVKRENDV